MHVYNVFILCLRCAVFLPAQPTEDVARLGVAPLLDQPAGRLGESPDEGKEEEEEDDLKPDREAPAEGGAAVVDKGEAVFDPVPVESA